MALLKWLLGKFGRENYVVMACQGKPHLPPKCSEERFGPRIISFRTKMDFKWSTEGLILK